MNKELEEFYNQLKGKKVAIVGLEDSNIPLLKYMNKRKTKVTVFDSRDVIDIPKDILDEIARYDMPYFFGKDALNNLKGFDLIFRVPSILPTVFELKEEEKRGAVVTTEVEIFMKLCQSTIIGVTGSDGKTTVSTLIYQILKTAGYNCYLGGSIGTSLLTRISDMNKTDFIILELSSFQLMNISVSPNVAVITNISPNHLNVHSSYEEYIEAKKNIFKYQDNNDILVLNYDNEITKKFIDETSSNAIFFSSNTKLDNGIIIHDGIVKECIDRVRRHVINVKDIPLCGKHNYENVCAAIAATKKFTNIDTQIKAIKEFSGVEHRIEFVREMDKVKWYNDSIATSPTRTMAGINSFNEKIVLIIGGGDKKLDYTLLAKPILERARTAILMGQTAEKIFVALKEESDKQGRKFDTYMVEKLEDAVRLARKISEAGDVILFSPASASFDSFKNFEERGERFKEIVNNI